MSTNRSMKAPPLLARLPFFYGWVVVAAAFVTMAIAVNARTSFSLLFPAILDEFGWERGATAAAFSVGFAASIALGPLFGTLMDRFGPRLVIPLGATMVALGLVASTFATTPMGFYATLGLLVVGGSIGASYLGHSMFLPNWFRRRRGLAVGIAFSGAGVGAILILPWLQTVIATKGWREACFTLAVIVVVVVIPINLIVPRLRPQSLGLEPDGDERDGDGKKKPPPDLIVDRRWAETDWTLRKAARTRRFWWVFVGYFTALVAWYSVQVHQTKYFIDVGFSAEMAAMALGLVGLFGIAGQVWIGALSDRVGREWGWTIALCGYVVCYLALMLLESGPSMPLLYLVVAAQGLFGYGMGSLYGLISADIFEGRRFATIFAILGLGGNLGAGAGPWLTGLTFDTTGSYLPAFAVCAGLSLVSIACMWIAAPRKVRLVTGQAARRPRI